MRSRILHPKFFKNEQLAEMDHVYRIFFSGLWCYADREGRLKCRPSQIKIEILPYDNIDIDRLIEGLWRNGFLDIYQINGATFIQIRNFLRYQHPNRHEASSEIHPPTTDTLISRKTSSEDLKKILHCDPLSFDHCLTEIAPMAKINERVYQLRRLWPKTRIGTVKSTTHELQNALRRTDGDLKIIEEGAKRYANSLYVKTLMEAEKDQFIKMLPTWLQEDGWTNNEGLDKPCTEWREQRSPSKKGNTSRKTTLWESEDHDKEKYDLG